MVNIENKQKCHLDKKKISKSVAVDMKKRRDLSNNQLYDAIYAPTQVFLIQLRIILTKIRKIQTYDKAEDLLKLKYVKNEEKNLRKELNGYKGRLKRFFRWLWIIAFPTFAEEWVFMAILGILVALFSYGIDKGVFICNSCTYYFNLTLTELKNIFFSKSLVVYRTSRTPLG